MLDYYQDEGKLFFQVTEDLTFFNIADFVSAFEAAIESRKTNKTLIDASKLSMADSSALNALAHQAKKLKKHGGYLYIYDAPAVMLETLHTTGLDKVVKAFPNKEKAMEHCEQGEGA